MNRTIKITVPESLGTEFLKEQARRYAQVYNHVVSFGLDNGIYNSVELHHKTYYTFASQEGFLPSQLICSARCKAVESIRGWLTQKNERARQIKKQQKKIDAGKHIRRVLKPISKPKARDGKIFAARYDARCFTIDFKSHKISFSSIQGRQKFTFSVNPYNEQYFTGAKVCSADLCWDSTNERFFFHIVLEFPDPIVQEPSKVLGVDLGLNNLAVTSNGQFYLKHSIRDHVSRIRGLRSRLQSKGTSSAKRHLKALSKKEHRFRQDVNHCITKQIVWSAKSGGYDTIAIEDLKNIRSQDKELRKSFRARLNSWPFDQFRFFLTYKALGAGLGLVPVDARYTSQKCSRCGHVYKAQRNGNDFHCVACGYQNHADLNASYNISKNCLLEVQLKETPGPEWQDCSGRAVVQPAYCSGSADVAQQCAKPTHKTLTSPRL